ncbi:MAG TPA: LysM peptidoglycan-binding domain-containing protein, partial [Bacteroidales bacterium]|nr:LysM peptidoglycan-binding domain-containing protein [Bacteroidales bacterium]
MLKRFIILLLITGFAAVLAVAQDIPVKRSSIVEQYKGKPYYLHFVKQGETLFAISKAYGVEVEEIVADNPGVEKALQADQVLRIPYRQEDAVKPETKPQTQVVQPQMKNPSSGETVYIDHFVSKKETLYGISKQYGVTVDDLIKANPSMTELKNGMVLKVPLIKKSAVGAQQPEVKVTVPEKLQIPDDGLLTVKLGQTIYSITKQYGITEEELLRLNPELSDGLKTGQTIRLKESALPLQTKTEPSTITVKTSEEEPVTINRSFEPCQPLKNNSTIYEVALLLPLNLEQADSIISVPLDNLKELKSYKTFDYFQLYAGVMMATDTLEKEGCRVNLHIYDADSESDTLKVKRVLKKSEMAQMDLIIGPVFARSFTIASRFAAQHNIPIVNPLSRRSAIIDNNPTVYKIYPGEGAIANALATYILKHQPEANIIVVRNTVAENELMVNAFADSVKGHSV